MAISHVKSNIVPDWTGTVTIGNSTGGTQTVAATDLVRPVDWNSAHNQYYTLSGNTNGASTASGTNVVLSGGNNVTLVGGGATVGFSVGNYITTGALSNHSHGNPTLALTNLSGTTASNSAGLTLSLSAAAPGGGAAVTRSGFDPFGHGVETVYGQQGAGTVHVQPMTIPGAVQFDRIALAYAGSNASNSSFSATLSMAVGLFTNNASTLSVLASTSTSFAMSASGTVGSYSLWAGPRNVTIPWTSTITGDVWVGIWSRTTTGGGAGMTFNQGLASQPNSAFSGILGVSSATNNQQGLGRGIYSVSSTTLPSNMPLTQINGTGSLGLRSPIFYFASGTV